MSLVNVLQRMETEKSYEDKKIIKNHMNAKNVRRDLITSVIYSHI